MKVAIVDVIGLTYDPTTLEKYGLGGSESAVIYMARELSNLGFDVTVFNNCIDSRAEEGIYDGVEYVDLRRLHEPNNYTCDVMIVSRTVIPFLPEHHWGDFNYPLEKSPFTQLRDSAKYKALWMHDTFCSGDHLVEELVVNGHIDEIFTLSDFHTTYVTNCEHGRRRNFEVLKNKMFMTRNGARKYIDEVDISQKDPNLFIYNASITKGMIPLIERIWPKVKESIPDAKLRIIGGYYRFRDGAEPDAQEVKFHEYNGREDLKDKLDIEFTGVIPQREIANHLAESSYMIFPGAFPETFGISSLESLLYNTPLITTRFGALEETAVENACYKIEYAIEPNSLFTDINEDSQVDKFVKLVLDVYNNPYLHMQKMNYCNIVHDISGWDGVALQWKQHIYKKLGVYLPVEEYRKVTRLNQRLHEVYGRRFSNLEEWGKPQTNPQQHISVITPVYNAESYIRDCILSVATQDYDNYTHYIIDDASTDNTVRVIESTIRELPIDIQDKYVVIKNKENVGAVCNQVTNIRELDGDDIVILLDGDDSLRNDNTIFHMYNTLYHEDTEFSYGSMWSMADNIPLIAQPYPKTVRESKSYREHKFVWGMPYTHLRTFKKYLIDNLNDSVFKDDNGEWFGAGGDNATFYNILEQADPDKVKVVTDIVYNYNDLNPLNDYKVNPEEQNITANKIRGEEDMGKLKKIKKNMTANKKKILLAIPTAKYIETETFKSIYDLTIPQNCEVDFQYFYGYNIDQVRNLIAHWAVNYDYLFSVDSDIVLPQDCLVKMVGHDVDMVSGIYIQRKSDVEIPEIYKKNDFGGISNVPFVYLYPEGLHEIDGCGFGCVLVKSDVIRKVGYPQFEYKSALSHEDTVSEDVDFCRKAQNVGAKIYVDSSIVCEHIGNTKYLPDPMDSDEQLQRYYTFLSNGQFREEDVQYLNTMKSSGVNPKVVYDIGACTGNWTREASNVWGNAEFVLFDALQEVEFLYKKTDHRYHIGVLSNETHKEVEFFKNVWHPGGNSYYREVGHPMSKEVFTDLDKVTTNSHTLDDVVKFKNFPLPDMIKIDVQGAELDVLKGAEHTLSNCTDLLIELQHQEYNKGAPLKDEVVKYIESLGFKLIHSATPTPFDGDYHFQRKL